MALKIKSRLWVESDGKILIGEGRVALLKAIDKLGSINLACKSLGMSYKKAIKMVQQMNALGDEKIVERKTGGIGGGGSSVTKYGQDLIQNFDKIQSDSWSFFDNELDRLNPTDTKKTKGK